MHNDIVDVVIFVVESVEEVRHQCPLANCSINIVKEIGDGFKLLAVRMN